MVGWGLAFSWLYRWEMPSHLAILKYILHLPGVLFLHLWRPCISWEWCTVLMWLEEPVVGRSISIRLVLPKSAEDLETINVFSVLSMWLSWCLTSCGISTSCSVIAGLLLSLACIWKLECSGKAGSSFWVWGSWVAVLVSSFLVFCVFS